MKNKYAILAVVAIVFAAGGFFGGMAYAKGKTGAKTASAAGQRFPGGAGAGGAGFRRGGANGQAGFAAGQILSKDDKSITLQTMGGGSKLVFISGSTTVSKSVSGALTDLINGTNVVVTGTPNSDGSITAQNVQIRPAGMAAPGAPAQGQ